MPPRKSSMVSRRAKRRFTSARWRAGWRKAWPTTPRGSNGNSLPPASRSSSTAAKPKEAIMTKLKYLLATAVLAFGASATPALADSIPGLRGHDHTGVTVPDVKAATAFFTDVLGCKHAMSFGPFMDDKGTFMQDAVNVNPRAVIEQILMVRCGYGSNIELFQYQSPDQAKTEPKNSDYGGHHIALYVDDIVKAAEYLRSKNVKTMQGPIP